MRREFYSDTEQAETENGWKVAAITKLESVAGRRGWKTEAVKETKWPILTLKRDGVTWDISFVAVSTLKEVDEYEEVVDARKIRDLSCTSEQIFLFLFSLVDWAKASSLANAKNRQIGTHGWIGVGIAYLQEIGVLPSNLNGLLALIDAERKGKKAKVASAEGEGSTRESTVGRDARLIQSGDSKALGETWKVREDRQIQCHAVTVRDVEAGVQNSDSESDVRDSEAEPSARKRDASALVESPLDKLCADLFPLSPLNGGALSLSEYSSPISKSLDQIVNGFPDWLIEAAKASLGASVPTSDPKPNSAAAIPQRRAASSPHQSSSSQRNPNRTDPIRSSRPLEGRFATCVQWEKSDPKKIPLSHYIQQDRSKGFLRHAGLAVQPRVGVIVSMTGRDDFLHRLGDLHALAKRVIAEKPQKCWIMEQTTAPPFPPFPPPDFSAKPGRPFGSPPSASSQKRQWNESPSVGAPGPSRSSVSPGSAQQPSQRQSRWDQRK
uniref:Uncharacterized protein n=1 Tax=Chromera velia CCMP2878 TaxID=1169474 RepID=A0A0G4HW36_9ALVE|eukprot:Cvel_8972.t1-p1 / transcript=Cvel_8972.t1 / gene=Cvel_8972 / organism=Chromera_velia_CCMP2878 / gene_product=hypothetical protein / transcript_product=hypothetical protein / location=Cvel_scaffold506:39920-41679(+) / protein_length=494 / sequence_SO=supercontig / SO=protein_coding / is_pseudo=false